jgi:hypothetical protein
MRPEKVFEIVIGHCIFQATRLRNAVYVLLGEGTGGFPEDQACYWLIKEGHATLAKVVSSADGAIDLVRAYASIPPEQGMRDAFLHLGAVALQFVVALVNRARAKPRSHDVLLGALLDEGAALLAASKELR